MAEISEIIKEAKEEEKKKEKKEAEVLGVEKGELIEAYDNVRIYKVPGELLLYAVPVPRMVGAEKQLIETIKDIATRVISIDPSKIRDPEERRRIYRREVLRIIEEHPELGIPEMKKEMYVETVVRDMVGLGPLDYLLADDLLEEIMVIGPKKPVYVFHRKYGMMKTNIIFWNDKDIQDIIDRIARELGRRIDINNPLLDARLPDGSRVNATIPPASVDGSTITLRKFRKDPLTIVDLLNFNTIDYELAAFLWLAVDGLGAKPANILIAGGTASGKTTTLNVLACFIPPEERVITIEDTAELNLPLEHWIRLEARPPGLEGKGELTMDILVKNALRMRPDRIIVGEIRHAEAFTLFTAINTGHDGSLGTVHANSVEETIVRVTSPPMNVPFIMLQGLDLILMQKRINDRRRGLIRRITEVGEIANVTRENASTKIIWRWDPVTDTFHRLEDEPRYIKILEEFTGLSSSEIWDEVRERALVLRALKEKGIRRQDEVVRIVRAYLRKKRGR